MCVQQYPTSLKGKPHQLKIVFNRTSQESEASTTNGQSKKKKEVGEYAVRHGPAKTVRALQTKYPGLTKQSVHDFKKVF